MVEGGLLLIHLKSSVGEPAKMQILFADTVSFSHRPPQQGGGLQEGRARHKGANSRVTGGMRGAGVGEMVW